LATWHLAPPLAVEQVRELQAGDLVYVEGTMMGLRDATLIRMFDEGVPAPTDLGGSICLHTAPGVRRQGDRYEKVSIGTTTSTRMNRFTEGLVVQYGVRAIAGKGGLLADMTAVLERHGAVYLGLVGGTAAASTMQIEEIEAVWWEDLMPECLWRFRVRDFGPLIVGVDAHGRNLYLDAKAQALARLSARLK
jgi:L(+)-tartrate dehydratase beta subunit